MRPIHLAGLILLGSMWGASFMFIKVLLDEVSPLGIAWLRLLGGGAVIVAVLVAMRERIPRTRRYWLDVCVVGVFGTAIPMVLIPWGEREIPSNLAAVLNGAMPFWAVIFSIMFLPAERVTRQKLLGVGLGFAGLAIIIGPDAFDIRSAGTQGQFAIILATVCYAAGAVYTRRRLLGVSPWMLAGAQNFAAFALVGPITIAASEVPDLTALSTDTLLAAAGLAVLSQGIAILIYYWLLSNLEATQASFVTYLAPVAAQFWGWVVLAEVPGLALVPGLAFVFAGMVLLNRRPRPVTTEADAPAKPDAHAEAAS